MDLSAAWWAPYAITAASMVVVAAAGIFATEIGPWYHALAKPSWQPPEWVFGPVWTTIYVLVTFAVGRAWNRMPDEAHAVFLALLLLNLVLNVLWSFLFFKWRRPLWGLVEVVPLWLSVLSLVVYTAPYDVPATLALLPYLVWVGVAAYLNLTIVRLNPRAHELAT